MQKVIEMQRLNMNLIWDNVTETALLLFIIYNSFQFSFLCLSGADRLYDNIQDMIGYRPWGYMKYCWKYLTPAICTVSTDCVTLLVA